MHCETIKKKIQTCLKINKLLHKQSSHTTNSQATPHTLSNSLCNSLCCANCLNMCGDL